MSDLKPCPFCGGEAEIKKLCDECSPEINFKCEHDKSQSATCPIGEKVFWVEHSGKCKVVHSEGEPFYTDSFTSAQQAVAAWNARAERTCECVAEYAKSPIDGKTIVLHRCSACHELMRPFMNYCPNCGRKIES